MNKEAEQILDEIRARKERNKSASREYFESIYNDMCAKGFPISEAINFSYDISESNQIDYHYELICENWMHQSKQLQQIGAGFYRHGREGFDYLFGQMDSDSEQGNDIAYLIAQNLEEIRHLDYYIYYCDKLIPYLIRYMENDICEIRRKAIIALGWIGTKKEIPILCECILTDGDSLCRSWAATAFMQMTYHRVSKASAKSKKVKDTFIQAFEQETDLFALGCYIITLQALFEKRWLSSSSAENQDREKIMKARKTAVNFLKKDNK